ncbi:hypothetical protein, partial [Mesorhizobium sp. M7A.F.Ca.US.007.01.1.1]|uniref:hypothetical protein n=1 Tax=Mesorhizobium sp. M7A.F.Ca.US.007.01.1.1 TaxID=2496712 RepID=UPI0019CFD27A
MAGSVLDFRPEGGNSGLACPYETAYRMNSGLNMKMPGAPWAMQELDASAKCNYGTPTFSIRPPDQNRAPPGVGL